jgi:hypothetical protein
MLKLDGRRIFLLIFKKIDATQTLVILEVRGRLISCEKNTTFVAKNINTLYTINIQSI